jgi:hypothetical protein
MKPKLAIVIPTRNRQEYCLFAVKQALSVCNSDIIIIVHDNSDNSSLGDSIKELNDRRTHYHYVSTQLSFVENFSKAVQVSDADYLCVIGDDDGILPTINDAIDVVSKYSIDALVPSINAVYFWPSNNPIVRGAEKGHVNLSYINYKYKRFDLEKGLLDLMNGAAQKYQVLQLPRLYHGIVKREIIEKVYSKTGYYFGGLTPDIYMSVALANVCETVIGIGIPITISGISPKSGSAQSATGEHTGPLASAPHFQGHVDYQWSKKVPAFYSVPTIWADTALHALDDFDRGDLIERFNIARMDAITMVEYKEYRKIIAQHMKETSVSIYKLILEAFKYFKEKYVNRLIRRILRKKGDVVKVFNVPDIFVAEESIMYYIDDAFLDRMKKECVE